MSIWLSICIHCLSLLHMSISYIYIYIHHIHMQVFLGAFFGYKQEPIEFPVVTSNIPRQIPVQSWYVWDTCMVYLYNMCWCILFVYVYAIYSSVYLYLLFLFILVLTFYIPHTFTYNLPNCYWHTPYTHRYLNPILTTLVGGVLPFGACFVSSSYHAICVLYVNYTLAYSLIFMRPHIYTYTHYTPYILFPAKVHAIYCI